jgi:hypothetical protein
MPGVRFLQPMRVTILPFVWCVTALLAVATSPLKVSSLGAHARAEGQVGYKVWRVVSFTDERGRYWLAFVSVEPALFNREGMSRLYRGLSGRYKRARRLKAFLFDDPRLAEAHAAFRAELRSLDQNMRGVYYLDRPRREAYIKYSSGAGKRWDEITIDFRKMRK